MALHVDAARLRSGELIWLPQPGPQTYLLTCPLIDIFYGGARGGGKTDGMLGHWMQHESLYGARAHGVFFRRTYKQLDRVLLRGRQLFGPLGARFKQSKDRYEFVFPSGAALKLRHLDGISTADEYQGHEYNWLCFEELPQWPDPAPVDMLRGTLRDAHGVPCYFLATGNPGGVGHVWVKERYIDAAAPFTPVQAVDYEGQPVRDHTGAPVYQVFIPAKLQDNPALLERDPNYVANLRRTGPDWLVKAWLQGDWNIAAGGFLLGKWDEAVHTVQPFEIPSHWRRWRAMDWGYARPYSVGWYAMDGDGKIYRYRELYGYGGRANVGSREEAPIVAKAIKRAELAERRAGATFRGSPADPEIWAQRGVSNTVASLMRKEDVKWSRARKGPGSRVSGAQVVVARLAARQFAVFNNCRHFLRTVPVIPADERQPEDVDTESEDHVWDELRYALTARHVPAIDPEELKRANQRKPRIVSSRPALVGAQRETL